MIASAGEPSAVGLFHRFADDRTFWRRAAVVLGALSFLRGMRRPSSWAATQALINYDFGVTKRGIFGAALGKWMHLERYSRFSVVSFGLLFLMVGLLVLFTVRSGATGKLGTGETLAVFFGSCTLTFLAHIVGYMDIVLGIITIGLLLIRDTRLRLVAAVPLCLVALLTHEAFLIIFFPCVLFSFAADIAASPDARQRTLPWAMLGALVLAVLGLTLLLSFKLRLSQDQITVLRDDAARRADFPIRGDVFVLLRRSVAVNFFDMMSRYRYWWMDLLYLNGKVVFLPTIALVLFRAAQAVRTLMAGRRSGVLMTAAVLAACSPLLMMFFGYDASRWDALCCLESFLVLLVLCRAVPGTLPAPPAGYRNAALLAITLSFASSAGMMDGFKPNGFPFIEPMINVVQDYRHSGWQPPSR